MSAGTKVSPRTQTLAGFMAGGRNWIGHADEAQTFDGPVPRDAALKLLSIPLVEASPSVSYPVITEDGVETVTVVDPDHKGVMRTDTGKVFRYFKPGYKIHQYGEWLVDNVDTILHGGLEIGTVAVTKHGALALVQVEYPEARVATAPGAEPVAHRPHMTAFTSADGSVATNYAKGTRVLICENEVTVQGLRAFGFTATVKIRHTSGSLARIGEIREDLGVVVEQIGDAFDEEFRVLVAQHVTNSKFKDIVDAFTGESKAKEGRSKTMATNKAQVLRNLWKHDERVAPWKNSAYGVLAAFNTAQHHEFGPEKERTQRNQTRLILGEQEKFDHNVLRLLASV
jgi:phage/plasmid-like protein (TIGR03299 family)